MENYRIIHKLYNDITRKLLKTELLDTSPELSFITSFAVKILSTQYAIDRLLKQNLSFEAMILTSHIIEGVIILDWLLLDFTKRHKDFIDFYIVENINKVDPKKILELADKAQLKRFLRKNIAPTIENLIKRENYCSNWFSRYNKNIFTMSEEIKRPRLYRLYRLSCSYKHFNPNIMWHRYMETIEYPAIDKELVCRMGFLVLYEMVNIYNRFYPETIQIDKIVKRYNNYIRNK